MSLRMTRPFVILCFISGLASTVSAQVGPDAWMRDHLRFEEQRHRDQADWISTGVVVAALVLPCATEHRTRQCWENEGLQAGVAVLGAEIIKRLVHRNRPDRSDLKSFLSEHTELACVATLRSKYWALCPTVGWMRIAADKHWTTDVGAGAGIAAGITFSLHPW